MTVSPGARSVLILEGGGLRGAFSAGVLSELDRHGVQFSDVVAVSSGAPSAAYFTAGQTEDALTIWRDHTHSGQLVDPRNVFRGRPILDVDRLIGVFRTVVPLHPTGLAPGRARLHIGVTDCSTGLARYVSATPGNIFELLRGTMALPIAYGKVVKLDAYSVVDGGVTAPIALAHALSLDPERIVVVLTRPRGYRRRASWLGDRLIGWSYPRHPNLRRAMLAHTHNANQVAASVEQLEDEGRLSVIRPQRSLPAGRLTRDPAKIHATIELGRRAAHAWLRSAT